MSSKGDCTNNENKCDNTNKTKWLLQSTITLQKSSAITSALIHKAVGWLKKHGQPKKDIDSIAAVLILLFSTLPKETQSCTPTTGGEHKQQCVGVEN